MAKKDKPDEISCEIKEKLGFLNPDANKIFARVSWNKRDPKFDIRKCYTDKEGNLKLSSGISLSEQEMEELVALYERHKAKQVDFDSIFRSATGITEKRKAGYRTENGFIRLTKKPSKR